MISGPRETGLNHVTTSALTWVAPRPRGRQGSSPAAASPRRRGRSRANGGAGARPGVDAERPSPRRPATAAVAIATARASLTRGAVEQLPYRVGVSSVSGRLVDQMQKHPPQVLARAVPPSAGLGESR